jgi:hypothetical protein
MPTGALISRSTVPRHVLQAGREILTWAYHHYDSSDECRIDFLAWLTGRERSQLLYVKDSVARSLLEKTANWKWLELRSWFRELLEAVFSGASSQRPFIFSSTARCLRLVDHRKGGQVLHWRSICPSPPTPKGIMCWALDDFLSDLDCVSKEALGKCAFCGHYFIRVYSHRGRYCSPHCRNKALDRKKGLRQPVGAKTSAAHGKR